MQPIFEMNTQELEDLARDGKAKYGGVRAFLRAAGLSASTFSRMRRGFDYRASQVEKLKAALNKEPTR